MERININIDNVLDIFDMLFDDSDINNIIKSIKDTFKNDVKKDLKKIRVKREYVLPFLATIKGFVPNADVVVISDSYFIFDETLKKGFAEITYSPEKNKVYFYVIHKNGRKKIFAKKLGDEIRSKEILKFIRELINIIKNGEHYRDLEILKDSKKFDLELFKENLEKDLGIKIIHFKIHTDKDSYIFKYISDDVTLLDVIKYIDEYLAELEWLRIKIPRVIEIKE